MTGIQIKSEAIVTTDQKWSIELTGTMLVDMLRTAGHAIPKDAAVSFHVPGGGDWSHMSIDVDAENPLYIEWKAHSVECREV